MYWWIKATTTTTTITSILLSFSIRWRGRYMGCWCCWRGSLLLLIIISLRRWWMRLLLLLMIILRTGWWWLLSLLLLFQTRSLSGTSTTFSNFDTAPSCLFLFLANHSGWLVLVISSTILVGSSTTTRCSTPSLQVYMVWITKIHLTGYKRIQYTVLKDNSKYLLDMIKKRKMLIKNIHYVCV